METKLLEYMESQGIDAFYVTKQANIRYTSRYMGGDAFVVISPKQSYVLTDPRCTEQAAKECPDFQVVDWRPLGSPEACLGKLTEENGWKTVAYEADVTTYKQWKLLQDHVHAELVGTQGVMEEFRSIKTPEEIHNLKVAAELASRAYELLLSDVRIGMTEKELEAKLSYYMVTLGGDTKPNFNLAISGARTSLLHGIPSNKALEYGDLVLLDFGIEYRGYTSDMTRVFVVGKATEEQKRLHRLVVKMLEAAENTIRDGVMAKDVCKAVEDVIRDTEYWEHYYSSLAHGVGLFVHEKPFLRPTSEDIIRENNVLAVEPAVFIPGWGGIHLEDDLLVTKDGCQVFSYATLDLLEVEGRA